MKTNEVSATRKVFLQRDYSRGTVVQFSCEMPEELNGRIPPDEFSRIIGQINSIFDDAERLSAVTCAENFAGCLTAYLIFLCMETHYEKRVKDVNALIHSYNEKYRSNGFILVDPAERGFRVIEICIFDRTVN